MAKPSFEHRIRIIAGEWRGRRLPVADVDGLRPSGDRVRETLFNWLAPQLHGTRVLDLFAGTGALGFEALSRGAAEATLVDAHPRVAELLRQNAALLGARGEVMLADARRLLASPPSSPPYDIVFVDPPFADKDPMQLCTLLHQNGWLRDGALVYVEQQSRDAAPAPEPFACLRQKKAGQVQFGLYSVASDRGEP